MSLLRLSSVRLGCALLLALLVSILAPTAVLAQQTYNPQPPVPAPVVHRGQTNVALGDYYHAAGERLELYRRADQLVIQLPPQGNALAVLAELTAPAGPLAGFGEVRDFGNGLKMLANPALSGSNVNPQNSFSTLNAALARLERDPRVRFSVPVFVNARLGTYAVATDELLVRLKPGVRPEDFFADARFARYEQAPASDAYLVRVAAGAGEPVLALAAALQGDARLLWAEPNFYQERQRYFVPNDTLFADQWHLRNTGQGGGTPGADAKLVPAWDVATTAGQGVVIAIVDDGPELSHPDLAVYTNTGEIAGNGIDDDNNGFIDDVRGWDFTNNDNDGGPSLSTDQHGTSVAGVAAARGNNATGVTGAAYQATIFPARIFFGPTPTSDANIAAALAYASGRGRSVGAANWRGADIVNNSWGGGAESSAIDEALTWAATNGRGGRGTIHYFATGNGSAASVSYPAVRSGTIASVIAVGASNNIDLRSSYSNFGPQVDFVAPSNDISNGGTLAIWTTDRLGALGYNGLPDQDYTNQFGGTSSATPLASGVGALLLALDPTLTVAQVRALMRGTTDRIGPLAYDANGFNVQYGYGRINADRLVRALDRAAVAVNLGSAVVASGSPLVQSSLAGETRTLTFGVRSTGELDLTLGAVQLSGAGEFTVSQPLGSSTLALGQATTFEVSFSSAAAGTFNATASFITNDPDAPTFSIPIQFDVSPVSIGGRVFEDRNGDGVIQPGETARVGETVYLDTDNSGTMNPPVETTIASAANLGLVISNAAPIASTLTPSGLGSELQGLEVRVTLTHTYVSDLRLVLQAPNGTSIELVSGAGGAGDNMTNTVFADDATVAISAGTAPFTGRFRPNQPLSTFFNSNPNGIWTLRVFDSDPADNGTLVNWSLIVRHSGEPRRTSNALGDYAFVGLAPGSYRVRSAPGSGWSQVSPAGAHQVTVIGNESNIGRDFGLARQNSVYGKVYNDLDASGTFAAANDTVRAGATVFLDTNGNSTLDPPVPVTLTRSPALPIPGNSTVTDTLVSTTAGAIAGITVTLNITHTWVSDLTVRLTSPTGTVITLVAGRGGSGDNFTGTVFDDAAAVAISAGTAPFTGSFRPEQPLSELIGQAAAGNWQLTAVDRFTADSGTLVNWSLNLLVSEEPSQTSDSFGNFRFDGFSGSNNLRLVLPGGLQLSEPLAGSYPLSLAAGELVQNRNFGLIDKAILVTPTAGLVTTEAGGTATFTVVLSSAPSADVVVGLSSSDTTEGTVSPMGLTFTPSNWSTPQTVTVTGVDDAVDDGDVGYSIVTAAATSADPGYNGMNPADVAVSNTDNDTAGVVITENSGTANDNRITVIEGGAAAPAPRPD
jgi:subtilisin-like proprotein convertase family protein/subtilisin family serine protease